MNRFLVASLVILIVAACGSSVATASPSPAPTPGTTLTAAPSVAPMSFPSVDPTLFPTEAFAALSDDPVPEDVAAKLQAALADTADGGGIAATVMTPDGTWSGAFGKADGVHDVAVDSQFGIASGTKPIVAAQVMQLVEAGEVSLDRPATDYLPADFTFDTNGATIRQLLSHQSGIPDWHDDVEEQFAVDRLRAWPADPDGRPARLLCHAEPGLPGHPTRPSRAPRR